MEPSVIVAIAKMPSTAAALVELEGLVSPQDARLQNALAPLGKAVDRVTALGSYAQPLTAEELAGARKGSSARKRG